MEAGRCQFFYLENRILCNRHFPNSLECTQNNSLKSRRGMKPIEKKCFLCPQNKFGKCLWDWIYQQKAMKIGLKFEQDSHWENMIG